MEQTTDVAIVGGGIVGSAAAYVLARYTTVRRITLLERATVIATESSACGSNSQTLHVGDIETNYEPDMARRVRDDAELIAAYLDRHPRDASAYRRDHKMVLAVGVREVAQLTARFAAIRDLYPALRLVDGPAIAVLESNVMAGRNPRVPVAALVSHEGYTVNFAKLAASWIRAARASSAQVSVLCGMPVSAMRRADDGFVLAVPGGTIRARAVVVCAGAYSLLFARRLGYGQELEFLPVVGGFYRTTIPNVLTGKVYTVQVPERPFAAVHGDADVRNAQWTRFGPTAKPVPMLARARARTIPDFLRTIVWSARGILSYLVIMCRPQLFPFLLKMLIIESVPFIGKRVFLRDARKIVPKLRVSDIERVHNEGGIRPQLVDTRTMALQHGEGRIEGDRVIFNVTPSPGASVSLAVAARDAEQVCAWLGATFDRTRFIADHTRVPMDVSVPRTAA